MHLNFFDRYRADLFIEVFQIEHGEFGNVFGVVWSLLADLQLLGVLNMLADVVFAHGLSGRIQPEPFLRFKALSQFHVRREANDRAVDVIQQVSLNHLFKVA